MCSAAISVQQNVVVMPRLSKLHRLQAIHKVKVEKVARLRAEKASIDARLKLEEDALEAYRRAIAKERLRRMRARKRDSSSESGERPPKRLALEDGAPGVKAGEGEAAGGGAAWKPLNGTWVEMGQLFKKLRRTTVPEGAVCGGVKKGQACGSKTVRRRGVEVLKRWPEAWGRERVNFLAPFPCLCDACDSWLRRH